MVPSYSKIIGIRENVSCCMNVSNIIKSLNLRTNCLELSAIIYSINSLRSQVFVLLTVFIPESDLEPCIKELILVMSALFSAHLSLSKATDNSQFSDGCS